MTWGLNTMHMCFRYFDVVSELFPRDPCHLQDKYIAGNLHHPLSLDVTRKKGLYTGPECANLNCPVLAP